MRSIRFRFGSAAITASAGIVLAVGAFTLSAATERWLGLAVGAGVLATLLVAFTIPGRGTIQRLLDALLAPVCVWTMVSSRTIELASHGASPDCVRWLGFSAGAAVGALGLISLLLHELTLESELRRAVTRLADQSQFLTFRRPSQAETDDRHRSSDGGGAPGGPDDADADSGMRWRGPLADSYVASAALVVFALVPYLVLTSSISPLQMEISRSVGLSTQALANTTGLANAGYAFGTVLAVQLAVRFRPRRLLLLYSVLLVAGSVLTALASTPGLFIAGHIVQGFCTSLMLIAALPPLVVGWPARRMPLTAGIMNLCIFGAVALGPVVGNFQLSADAWRPLFWMATGASALALLLVVATWEDTPIQAPGRWDLTTMILAGGGSVAAFFGASELTTHPFLSVITFLPLLAGVGAIVLLVIHQATVRNPLIPVRELFSSKPMFGVIAAMAAGASSVPAIDLAGQALEGAGAPAHIGSLFWPFFGMAVLMAVAFGLTLRTRGLIALVLIGLTVLAGGIAVLTGVTRGPHSLVAWGSGMVGFGVGSSVAPALFIAGYSVRVVYIQKVLALVELFRAVAAFMTAPILLHLAMTADGGNTGGGIRISLWVCFAIACTGGLLTIYILVLGRVRLQRPDIAQWQEDDGPAWRSPRLADGIRTDGQTPEDDLAFLAEIDGLAAFETAGTGGPGR